MDPNALTQNPLLYFLLPLCLVAGYAVVAVLGLLLPYIEGRLRGFYARTSPRRRPILLSSSAPLVSNKGTTIRRRR